MSPELNMRVELQVNPPASLVIESTWTLPEHLLPLTVPVDVATAAKWLAALETLRVPPVSDGDLILDGTQYAVTVSAGSTIAEFHWSEGPPRGWGGLERLTREILRVAREYAEAAGPG